MELVLEGNDRLRGTLARSTRDTATKCNGGQFGSSAIFADIEFRHYDDEPMGYTYNDVRYGTVSKARSCHASK